MNKIKSIIKRNLDIKNQILNDKNLISTIDHCIEVITNCFKNKNKLLFCGNGGSAADAQHFVAEFIGRFEKERDSIPAIALTTDTSIITAIGNDYGYEKWVEKAIDFYGDEKDSLILIAINRKSVR